MLEVLIKLGLQEKEAKVYMALLELGGGTVTELTQYAGINRTSAYDILARLAEMGIVSESLQAKKQSYTPEPPEKFISILRKRQEQAEEQAKSAEAILPELRALFRSRAVRPRAKIVEGAQGIRSLYEDSLFSSEPIRSFTSTDAIEGFDPKFLHEYYRRRAKKGVFIKAIVNDVPAAHEYKNQDPQLLREIRIVPRDRMDINTEVYIYDDKVSIFSLQEKLGVSISSPDMAYALKKLYDLAWERAGELESSSGREAGKD